MFKRLIIICAVIFSAFSMRGLAQDISWMDSYRASIHQTVQDNEYDGPSAGYKPGTFYGVYTMADYFAGFGLAHKWDLGFYGRANFGMSYTPDKAVETGHQFGLNFGAGFGLGVTYQKEIDQQGALKAYYFADMDRIGMSGVAVQPAIRYGNFLFETTITKATANSRSNKVTMSDYSVIYLMKHSGYGLKFENRGAVNKGLSGASVSVNQIHLVFMLH